MRRMYLILPAALCGVVVWGLWHGRAAADEASAGGGGGAVHLESAVLLGDGGTLRMLNVPIASASGEAKCYDITCKMSAGADGSIHMDNISVVPTTMVPNLADQFVPGKYIDGWGWIYDLHGPAASIGGRSSWSFQREPTGSQDNQKNLPPFSATWTTGPVVGSPDIANQIDIKTLPLGFSYGFANGTWPGSLPYAVSDGLILGARQIGDSVQIDFLRHNDDKKTWAEQSTWVFTAYTPPPVEK